jgi:hypothetical protein
MATYISSLLSALSEGGSTGGGREGVLERGLEGGLKGARVGVVQTAYANGASTRYIVHTLKLQTEVRLGLRV